MIMKYILLELILHLNSRISKILVTLKILRQIGGIIMFEKIARWYLSRLIKKANLNNFEMVIRSDSYTWQKRNFEREKSIEKTVSLIK